MLEFMKQYHHIYVTKTNDTQMIDQIISKKILQHLHIFFKINSFGSNNPHKITKRQRVIKNTTLKNLKKPRILHIITKKGHGLEAAEENPLKFHGISPPSLSSNNFPSYSSVFGKWLCDTAKDDQSLIGITPAMSEGSGMVDFANSFPERFVDVAIAEQHAVTLAGGIATKGLKPVVAIYSTFLQRGYDQFIHDIALQNLNVTFAIDRAGLVGADGATHAGIYDLSFLRCIPNIIIIAPSSSLEMYKALNFAHNFDGPVCVRFPRGKSEILEFVSSSTIELGKGNIVKTGKDTAIFAFGNMLEIALEASEKINATVVDMRFVKPLDKALIIENKTHPEEEIDKVTTPKGCTIVGLNTMEHSGFSSALIKGIVESYRKIEN